MHFPRDAWAVLGAVALPALAAAVLLLGALLRKGARRLGLRYLPAPAFVERPWGVRVSIGVLLVYPGLFLYGWAIEPDWVEVTRTELAVDQPVLGQNRFRIVHLSDLHLRGFARREARVADLVREAKPDLIVFTGDYGHTARGLEALVRLGNLLEAPYGRYGVRGNDDYAAPSRRTLAAAGIHLLESQVQVIERDGRRLCLAGQQFGSRVPLDKILTGQRADDYTIFLHHMPDAVDELGRLDGGRHVDLFLCGHTHGGQVRVPFWGAIVTESKYHKKYEAGLYRAHGVPVYVSRGIGLSIFPIRLFCRPEIAVIDLVHAPSAGAPGGN
jgi:predicted MPP superfamily phosphohydrolase